MSDFSLSINRAERLLNSHINEHNYLTIKLRSENGGCCCRRCWHNTWEEIDHRFPVYTDYIDNERDYLVTETGVSFVLECHETGPEIIAIVTASTAILNLSIAIANIIIFILKTRGGGKGATFTVTRRTFSNGKIIEESIISLKANSASEQIQSKLAKLLSDIIDKK